MEKALDILRRISRTPQDLFRYSDRDFEKAIEELEEEKRLKCASIEELKYALLKPEYATVYLNNALRFLKEI